MLCEKCAKEIPDNARFCPYCSEATAAASKSSPATGSIPGSVEEGEATRVDFHDFQLRALGRRMLRMSRLWFIAPRWEACAGHLR